MSDIERLGGLSKQYENIQINDNAKAHLGDTYHTSLGDTFHSTNHYGNNYTSAHYHGQPDPEQCLRDLLVTDPREDKERIEQNKDRLLKQCYGWILEDTSFQRWRAKGNARLLWIKGNPGKGKTMMTMGLVNELSKDRLSTWKRTLKFKRPSPSHLLAYFFCQSTRPELNNAASVLRGLIYLLVVQRKSLISHVQSQYRTKGNKIFEGTNAIYALKNILSDILNDPTLPTTYLLVDALDECTSGLPELLRIITDTPFAQRSRVKWLVTSRNIPEIKQFLDPSSTSDKVSLELNASHISKAVTTFIDFKVKHLATSKKYDSQTQKMVQQMLNDRAENTFLWVSLVCSQLEDVSSFRTKTILHEFPPGLNPLYDRMLQQIQAQGDAQTKKYCVDILRSMTLAYRPLHLKEIAVTAGLPRDQFTSVGTINDLISHCGSFFTIDDDIVSFVHLSVKDYFMSGKGKQVFNSALIEEKERMAYRLLDAMDNTLLKDMCNLKKPGAQIQEAKGHIKKSTLPLIAYACEYWIAHVSACPQDSNILSDNGKTYKFLQAHLLHWLEALGWMGKTREGIQGILFLAAHVPVNKSPGLYAFIHDTKRFVLYNRFIIEQVPLQLYCSALVFSPQTSIVRETFENCIPPWIKRNSRAQVYWSAALQTLEGHSDIVYSVAFSPDGTQVVSGSWDRTVRLWDAATGTALQTLEGHSSGVNSVAFSPDSKLLPTLHVSGYWIAEGTANILWLPPDSRSVCDAVCNQTVVLGHSSGGVSFLEFKQGPKLVYN